MSEPRTILLADDSESDILLMRMAFEQTGFLIPLQEVHNGAEAIAYLRGTAPYDDRVRFPLPTLMLLDLNMPMKDGFDVLSWARAQPGLKRLSIVVLSASSRPQDIERAFDAGASAFMVKPRTFDELVEMIRVLQDWMQVNQFSALAVQTPNRSMPGQSGIGT
jgi:CheY-like chemotaxis protein